MHKNPFLLETEAPARTFPESWVRVRPRTFPDFGFRIRSGDASNIRRVKKSVSGLFWSGPDFPESGVWIRSRGSGVSKIRVRAVRRTGFFPDPDISRTLDPVRGVPKSRIRRGPDFSKKKFGLYFFGIYSFYCDLIWHIFCLDFPHFSTFFL